MSTSKIFIKYVLLFFIIAIPCVCLAQSNKLKLSQIKEAVQNNFPNKVYITLSKKDIDETDTFVYSESNGSLLEDTPYWITVSEASVSIFIKSLSGDIDETFALSDSQYANFKKRLSLAKIRVIRNEAVAGLCGAPNIELSLFKKKKNYFKYDTLDPDKNLSFDHSLDDIFWKLIPFSLEELVNFNNNPNDFEIE